MLAWPACGGALGPAGEEPSQPDPSGTSSSGATASTAGSVTTGATTTPPVTASGPTTSEAIPTTSVAPPPTGAVPANYLDAVIADAGSRTGLGTSDLKVVKAEPAEWSDGSLDCPEPGMLYTQAIVSGFWVIIETPQGLLDYRLDATGGFRLCQSA